MPDNHRIEDVRPSPVSECQCLAFKLQSWANHSKFAIPHFAVVNFEL